MLSRHAAILQLTVILIFLSSCACTQSNNQPNLGDLKTQVTAYKNSGAYDRDLAAVDAEAQAYIEQRADEVRNPAIILDIDETSLSNWTMLKANDFANMKQGSCINLPQGPCASKAWQQLARADAIAPTVKLFNAAKAKGVTIFFITGRDESVRAATEKNLLKAGYYGWKQLIMRPAGTTTPSAADYKAPARAKIEAQGYTIIASVGDQLSDLAGGHAERAFLLPDPFYRIP